jgi:DNA-binding NtrC family response regulator
MPRRGERRVSMRERRQTLTEAMTPPSPAPAPPPRPVAAPPPAPPAPAPSAASKPAEPPSLKEIGRSAARAAEREMMLRMLHRTRWNRKEAAENLGISYKALLYKIKEHRLDDPVTDLDPRSPDSADRN